MTDLSDTPAGLLAKELGEGAVAISPTEVEIREKIYLGRNRVINGRGCTISVVKGGRLLGFDNAADEDQSYNLPTAKIRPWLMDALIKATE